MENKVYVLVHKIYAHETPNYSESYGEWDEGIFSSQKTALSSIKYNHVINDKYYINGNDNTYWSEWYEIKECELV